MVFWHYAVAVYCFSSVCSCFLLCAVIVHSKTFVILFTGVVFFLFLSLSLLFDMRTVVFTLCATWWLYLHDLYCCHRCILLLMFIGPCIIVIVEE